MANNKKYSGLSQVMDFMTPPAIETEVEETITEKKSTETVSDVEPRDVATPKKKKTVIPKRKSVDVPDGYKKNPEFIEKRTRRVQLYFQPSVYEKAIKKMEDGSFNSMNDYIHYLVSRDVELES